MLRKLIAQPLPEVPAEQHGWRSFINQALTTSPLAPAQVFWDNLLEFQAWWPILLPVLFWIGWRTYKRERTTVLNQTNIT